MRKGLFYLISVAFTLNVVAQDKKADSLSFVRAWTLTQNFSQRENLELDTNLPGFQIFNPVYQYAFSNSYLSNLGTPVIQNVYDDRVFDNHEFFVRNYMPYFFEAERTRFYNTTQPFTRLVYTTSGPNENREQTFGVVHSQNITPKLNFGLGYNVISSKGQYRFQQLKKNSFQVSSNYLGTRYTMHAAFNLNRHRHDENGGIDQEYFESGIIDSDSLNGSEKEIPVTFRGTGYPRYVSNARNRIRYYDLMVSQRLRLFTIESAVDTTNPGKARNMAEPILTYTFHMNRATKTYEHTLPNDTLFYDNTYFSYDYTLDSVAHFQMRNAAQLEFKTTFRGKVQAGVFGVLGNEYEYYHQYSEWDTTNLPSDTILSPLVIGGDTLRYEGYRNKYYNSNFYFTAGIYGNVLNRFRARFEGSLYFIGYKAGQSSLKGWLSSTISIFNNDYIIEAMAGIENKVPSYLLNTYYSNHYAWDQSLNSEVTTSLSGKISAPSNNFELRLKYSLLSNFLYFTEAAIPSNYGQPLNLVTLELSKTFKVWKLRSLNKLAYQLSENSNVLPLPDLVIFNSTYFDHTFHFESTGGELQMNLGFDIYYTTEFEGYEYSPALAQFYVQPGAKKRIGNYPITDAFFSLKLKSVQFFVKAAHFYGRWTEQTFYSAIGYPNNRYALKFGFSWTFHD